MKTYLLVEGKSAPSLLQRLLLPEMLSQTTIITTGERSNITSNARSLMVTRPKPLALVADAHAVEKDAVEQRQEIIEELIGAASAGVPFKVILAVPEIEAWFFEVPEPVPLSFDKKCLQSA